MKKAAPFLLRPMVGALLFLLLQATACRKERQPDIYGDWETITTVGFKWQYAIDRRGQFCKALPEYFPETNFCYDYSERADSTFIHSPTPEVWVWEFEGQNVAVVTAFIGTDPGDLEKQQFILRRTAP